MSYKFSSAFEEHVAGQAVDVGARWAASADDWQLLQFGALRIDDVLTEPGAIVSVLRCIADPDDEHTEESFSNEVLGTPDASDFWAAWFARGAAGYALGLLRAGRGPQRRTLA